MKLFINIFCNAYRVISRLFNRERENRDLARLTCYKNVTTVQLLDMDLRDRFANMQCGQARSSNLAGVTPAPEDRPVTG